MKDLERDATGLPIVHGVCHFNELPADMQRDIENARAARRLRSLQSCSNYLSPGWNPFETTAGKNNGVLKKRRR
jgi:hypothetical protein